MIYSKLIYEFLKIGIFSFGGGYATIPFLMNISEKYSWYSLDELSQMIAVASITPGPVGVNTATYAGIKTAGIFGAFCATTAEVLPSLIFVIIISKILKKYKDNFYIKSSIETLKPVSCALLAAVGIKLIQSNIIDIKSIILLSILLLFSIKIKRNTLFYIVISGIAGIILQYTLC